MKKISVLLCGIGIACVLTGCGDTVPELTQEENEIITEYAVGLLLKYDKYHNNRLVDLAAYEEANDSAVQDEPVEEPEEVQPEQDETPVNDAEVVELTEEEPTASSIEEFYGINGFAFQYSGYELMDAAPAVTENEGDAFFVMNAEDGNQFLVLKFQVMNLNDTEQELDMMAYRSSMEVSVNGDSYKNVERTISLNDLLGYKGVLGAGESTELVANIEVPIGTSIGSIAVQLKNDTDSAVLYLQ